MQSVDSRQAHLKHRPEMKNPGILAGVFIKYPVNATQQKPQN